MLGYPPNPTDQAVEHPLRARLLGQADAAPPALTRAGTLKTPKGLEVWHAKHSAAADKDHGWLNPPVLTRAGTLKPKGLDRWYAKHSKGAKQLTGSARPPLSRSGTLKRLPVRAKRSKLPTLHHSGTVTLKPLKGSKRPAGSAPPPLTRSRTLKHPTCHKARSTAHAPAAADIASARVYEMTPETRSTRPRSTRVFFDTPEMTPEPCPAGPRPTLDPLFRSATDHLKNPTAVFFRKVTHKCHCEMTPETRPTRSTPAPLTRSGTLVVTHDPRSSTPNSNVFVEAEIKCSTPCPLTRSVTECTLNPVTRWETSSIEVSPPAGVAGEDRVERLTPPPLTHSDSVTDTPRDTTDSNFNVGEQIEIKCTDGNWYRALLSEGR